ncbi:MAG: hypothetical protein ACPLX7_03070 [Candidatus Kapaibacteriota bacterium]
MKNKQLYDEMVEILQSIGYRVRKDSGSFNGGACFLKDEKIIVLNKILPIEAHLSILANILYEYLDKIYIKPRVREFVEKEGNSSSNLIEIVINKSE